MSSPEGISQSMESLEPLNSEGESQGHILAWLRRRLSQISNDSWSTPSKSLCLLLMVMCSLCLFYFSIILSGGGNFGNQTPLITRDLLNTSAAPAPQPLLSVEPERVALVVIAHDRDEYFKKCLQALLRARNLDKVEIIVSIDNPPHYESTFEIAKSVLGPTIPVKFLYHKFPEGRTCTEGKDKITYHMGEMLRNLFDEEKYDYVISLEDDLIVSSDFIDFMLDGRYVLSQPDDSILCISSWQDNGMKGQWLDESRLIRSQFFPGLGWMMKRSLWDERMRSIWGDCQHYDWMIRGAFPYKDCIVPEMSRTHHIAKYGTHFGGNGVLILEKMALASGNIPIPKSEWELVAHSPKLFEQRLRDEIFQDPNNPITVLRNPSLDQISIDKLGGNTVIVGGRQFFNEKIAPHFGIYAFRSYHQGVYSLRLPKDSHAHALRATAGTYPYKIVTLLDEQYVNHWGITA